MPRQLHLGDDFAVGRRNGGKSAAAEADVDAFGRRIVANVVRVIAETNHRTRTQVVGVQQLQPFALTVGHRDQTRVSRDGDPLRLPKTWQALEMSAGPEVKYFNRVID